VCITGIGVIVPGAIGNQSFLKSLTGELGPESERRGGTIPDDAFLHLLNARRVRRMSEQVKLTLAATALALQDADVKELSGFAGESGAILASQHGSTNYSVGYYTEIVKGGLAAANPMLFAEGVPNACSAHLSLMLSIKGACQTIIGMRTAGLDALRLASMRIATGAWDHAIVAAAEEDCEIINRTYRSCGLYAEGAAGLPFAGERGFIAGSAAVSFILESRSSVEARGGRVHGRVLQGASSRIVQKDPTSAASDVLARLGSPQQVISSANGTWIDRAELAALRRSCPGATITSIHGHVPEAFSAGPLLALAGTMLSGKMIPLRGGLEENNRLFAASGEEPAISVVSLCTDYARTVSGVGIAVGNG
jgi:3-oxoacyl-[acyl-carrier-protein] synthase II